MTDLADFLRARIAERRQAAMNAALTEGLMGSLVDFLKHEAASVNVGPSEQHYALQAPGAVLADLDAKLAIVDLMERTLRFAEGDSEVDHYGALANAEETLSLLARPFAGHPDYQEDWAA